MLFQLRPSPWPPCFSHYTSVYRQFQRIPHPIHDRGWLLLLILSPTCFQSNKVHAMSGLPIDLTTNVLFFNTAVWNKLLTYIILYLYLFRTLTKLQRCPRKSGFQVVFPPIHSQLHCDGQNVHWASILDRMLVLINSFLYYGCPSAQRSALIHLLGSSSFSVTNLCNLV